MGHIVTGVVGASLISGKKTLAIVGDGAMLMNNEISTAVKYGARTIWVVLNDSQYGITDQGMRVWGFDPVETAIPQTDFAQISRAMGGAGIRVEQEAGLEAALDQAMGCPKPCVLDVIIDRREISPVVKRRIGNLMEQETGRSESR
jgi:acetolactate synthase-1/2/3 large subunit